MLEQDVRNNFNRAATSYEKMADAQKLAANYLAKLLYSNLASDFFPSNILDIGVGTGFLTEVLMQHFPQAHYTLNDLAPNMLEVAAKKFESNANVQFLLGDAEMRNFDDAELIVSNFAFQWFKNLENSLNNLWTRTKVMAFSTLSDDSFASWKILHQELGLPCKIHDYPSVATLQQYCLDLKPQKHFFATQSYSLEFANPAAFAVYLKELGANAPKEISGNKSNIATNHNFRKLYKSKSSLTTSYEVFFAVLIK